MKREPVITTATITSAVAVIIAALVAFGLPLTDEQSQAVLGVAAVLAPLVVTVARQWTYSKFVVEAELPVDGADSPEHVDPEGGGFRG